MSDLAVSDPLGANISGSTTVVADGGRISVLGAITPPVFANFDLSPWEVFGGGLPWTLVDGFSEQSYPYLNVTANGVVPIEISSSSDGTADGWQGFSSGSNRVTYASDTVYVARFNVRVETSDAPGIGGATVNDFPVARFRFLDFALNSAAEMFVDGTSVGMADTPPGGGLSQSWTFEVFFEPSDVSANNVTAGVDPFEDLFLEFDMFDFLNDKQGHIILDSVEVATLVKSEVDAQFSTVLDVSNFQDDSQIILGLPGFGFDQIAVADPNIGLFRIEGFDSVTRNVNDIVVSTPATFAEASPPVDPIGALQEFGTPVATATPAPPAELRNNKTDVVWRQVVTASSADPVNTSEIRLRITDAFGRTASHYFVFRQLGRMRGDATGINRPDADGETYFNYFTYPENSNVASLIGDPNTETIQGLVGLVDFTEPSPPQAQGPITFSEFRMETAPRNRLLP
jgi:hypothetical protein